MSLSSRWDMEQFVGKGGFAKVFRVREKGTDFALKKIHSYLLKDEKNKQKAEREIKIMEGLEHPNIIKLHETIRAYDDIDLLLQYAPGGSLFDQRKTYHKIAEPQVKRYAHEIVSALEYLHNRPTPILHRDIKTQNVLIDAEGHCKLADFGSSNLLERSLTGRLSFEGTEGLIAPQIQEGKPHGTAVDVWCLGVLIYQLLTGEDFEENPVYPTFLSRPAQDVIKRLLCKDPDQRMTLEELKDHIWLSQDNQRTSKTSRKKVSNKLEELRNKLRIQRGIPSLKPHSSTESSIAFQQEKSNMEQHEEVVKDTTYYIDMIKERQALKERVKLNQKRIDRQERRRREQRPYVLKQIERLHKQIKEYQSNIAILSQKPLKLEAECKYIISKLIRALEDLSEYISYIPQKIKSDVLTVSSRQYRVEALPISQYIYKLKMGMLTARRAGLIELIATRKTYTDIRQMIQIQQGFRGYGIKEETPNGQSEEVLKQQSI